MMVPDELPPILHGYECSQDTIGKSGNSVFRLTAPGRRTLIIKIFQRSSSHAATREHERLNWLNAVGIAAPRALDIVNTRNGCWLIMECLPGWNAVVSTDQPATKVRVLAGALSRLHALRTTICPFDETLTVKIAGAQDNMRGGLVDEHDFEEDHRHMSAGQLFAQLRTLYPTTEDIVVVHGDASLPNFILKDGQFNGFVDCGSVGLSDRYQDLAICCRSIRRNFGGDWIDPFLQAYGMTSLDENRMRFYQMLDEFF